MQAAFQPPEDRGALVVRKIEPGRLVQVSEDGGKGPPLVVFERLVTVGKLDDPGMVPVRSELLRQLPGRERQVDQSGGEGARGHALILGVVGGVHHRDAAGLLDGAEAETAVAPGAGQHNAHRVGPLIRGQRPEEAIHRGPIVPPAAVLHPQVAVLNGEVLAGRDHVHRAAGHRRPVLRPHHPQGGLVL